MIFFLFFGIKDKEMYVILILNYFIILFFSLFL